MQQCVWQENRVLCAFVKNFERVSCFVFPTQLLHPSQERASGIIIPLGFWVVSAIFFRLQTSLGCLRRSVLRPYSNMTSSFDSPVMEQERWYKAGMGAVMRIAGDSDTGCFATLPLGFFGMRDLGFFVSLPCREGWCSAFTLFFRPGPSDLRIMNVNGAGFSLW